MRRLHIDFGSLFGGFDEAEGFIQILSRTVDAVHRPDDETGALHFLSGGESDLVGAAEHPGQNIDPVRKDNNTFRTHLPEGTGEFPLIQRMNVGHGKKIGRVAVHDHMVFRIDLQAGSMAHHVRRKF